MNKSLFTSIIMGMLMVSSGVLAYLITPSVQPNDLKNKIDLETIIPVEFDGWKIDPFTAALVINPEDKSLQNKIYNQTLSRTYINKNGERVMLSIAYGRDQSTDMHVHRPEICYTAGGFEVGKLTKSFVDTAIGRIPVMHLVAKQLSRNEPITYWVRIGDSLTRGWFEQKFTTIGYGLTGKIPDGLLFRVSTISNDEKDSYRIQQSFLTSILQAVRSEDRYLLVGKLSS
jgi:EpsI family protein